MVKKNSKRRNTSGKLIFIGIVIAILAVVIFYFLFTGMSRNGEDSYIYIDNDDTVDSVYNKIEPFATPHSAWALRTLGSILAYNDNIHAGRYLIGADGALQTMRKLRNGTQASVHLTIQSVRTLENLAEAVARKMSFSEKELLNAISNADTCAKYGYTPETIICMFVPNTYDIYWNASVGDFLGRMKKESNKFWTMERKKKAEAAELTLEQVMTIASIVSEETNNKDEKPIIAGIYINRIKSDMPLQSCPTVKFAMKRFDLKRLYTSMLSYDSPYNTYKYKGLPPGPIRNPNIEDIDAVLNYRHHKYLYMCAKPDFSGTHDFAETYEEHSANSKKYDEELNKRGIK